MSSEAEKAVVRSNTEAVQSQGDFDLFEALFADDVLDHTPQPNMTPDKPGVRGLYKAMREAFPDFHAVIHWQTADGEIVTTFTTSHGTHQGTFLGVAPTGRKVHVETVDAMRVHDGKITEHGGVANLCSCMQQLSGSNPDTTKEIPMTTQRTTTADAMTTLKLTPKFDVTYLPRKIEALLAETEKPLHRAILKNYLRHALLEISGYWDQILVPELTIAEPVYRVSERGQVHVLTGHAAVERFYREVHDTGQNVMAARTLNMAVGDFGVITEAVWNHMTPGATLVGEIPDADPHAHYLIAHHIMQNFAYTSDAKLIGERVYDDPASYSYEKLAPANVVTPEIAREQLAPFLARATLDGPVTGFVQYKPWFPPQPLSASFRERQTWP